MNLKLYPISPNTNQITFESLGDSYIVLFSYKEPIAAKINGKCYKTNKFWSRTTSKHINSFFDGREVEEKEQEFFDNLVK